MLVNQVSSVINLEELTKPGPILTPPQNRDGQCAKRVSGALHWPRALQLQGLTKWSLATRVSITLPPTRFLSQTVSHVLLEKPVMKREWV